MSLSGVLKVVMNCLRWKVVAGHYIKATSFGKTQLIKIAFLELKGDCEPPEPDTHCSTCSAVCQKISLLKIFN